MDSVKKECLFVLGATNNLDFAIANTIIGLDRHIKHLDYDIIVYENNFSEKVKNIISSIHKTQFINYKFPIDYHTENEHFKYFTNVSFSIYECLNHLKNYQNVVWLDCDILIQKDFSNIIKNNDGITVLFQSDKVGDNLQKQIYELNMNAKECNSGVVFFNDTISNYKNLADWCYKTTVQYADILLAPDQTVISLMIDKFNIKTNILHRFYNCMPFDKQVKQASIIHTTGGAKLWNAWAFPEWEKNNKIFEKLLGEKIKIKRDNIIVRKARNIFKSKYNFLRRTRMFILSIIKPGLNFK